MDVLGSYACQFRFEQQRIDLNEADPSTRRWLSLTTEPHRTPAVEVRWGPNTLTAVWDTRAGITIVDQAWAAAHQDIITITDDLSHGTDATGATISHPQGRMAPCTIGGLDFIEQVCGVVDLSALNAGRQVPLQMIIGLPLITQATWCIDFPRRRWTVYR